MVHRHPLERLSDPALGALSVACLMATVLCLVAALALLPGRESATVLDFVQAFSAERARAVAVHWSVSDRVRIAHAVGLDYLMNPAYLTLAAALCIRAGRRWRGSRVSLLGPVLAWLAWSGVPTNWLENVALLLGALDRVSDPWPALATASHYWSGIIVAASLAYAASSALRQFR